MRNLLVDWRTKSCGRFTAIDSLHTQMIGPGEGPKVLKDELESWTYKVLVELQVHRFGLIGKG